jgi:hypothetical protein
LYRSEVFRTLYILNNNFSIQKKKRIVTLTPLVEVRLGLLGGKIIRASFLVRFYLFTLCAH